MLNILVITSSLDLFLRHATITHTVSPDTVTNVCRDTLNFICMPMLLIHLIVAYCLYWHISSLFQDLLQHLQLQMDAIQNIFMFFCKLRNACASRGGGQHLRNFSLPTVSLTSELQFLLSPQLHGADTASWLIGS